MKLSTKICLIQKKSSTVMWIRYFKQVFYYMLLLLQFKFLDLIIKNKKIIVLSSTFIQIILIALIFLQKIKKIKLQLSIKNTTITKNISLPKTTTQIYTICVDDILINKKDKLKELHTNNKIHINEIYKNANKETKYKDGGSTQYMYDNFIITKCQILSGRKDIVITMLKPDISVCENSSGYFKPAPVLLCQRIEFQFVMIIFFLTKKCKICVKFKKMSK